MELSSGSAKGEFNYLPYLTIRMPSFFFAPWKRLRQDYIFVFALVYLLSFESTRYSRARATSNLPTYLPTSYHRFEKIASLNPPSSSPLSSPRLASSSSTTIPFFLLYPQKKNSRQVSTSAPSLLFKWVPILDWSHWTKLDKAERLWRLQPAVQLIYKVPTVCM